MAGEKKTLKTRLIQVGSQKFDAPYSLADLIITTDGKTVKEILDEFDVEIGNPKDVDNNIEATGLYKLIEDKTIDTSTLQLKEDNSLITTDKTVVGAIAEIINEYLGSKKLIYLTQAEYDLLSDSDKNDTTKVYNITDAVEKDYQEKEDNTLNTDDKTIVGGINELDTAIGDIKTEIGTKKVEGTPEVLEHYELSDSSNPDALEVVDDSVTPADGQITVTNANLNNSGTPFVAGNYVVHVDAIAEIPETPATGMYKHIDIEIKNALIGGEVDLSGYQEKTSDNLNTVDKTIEGAINELNDLAIELTPYSDTEIEAMFENLTPEEVQMYQNLIDDNSVSTNRLFSSQGVINRITEALLQSQKYANDLVSGLSMVKAKKVETKPDTGIELTIYLVGNDTDGYHQWMFIEGAWADLGTTNITLNGYITEERLTEELAKKADDNKVLKLDKVTTTMSGTPSNDNVLSELAIKNLLDGKADSTSIPTVTNDLTDELKANYDAAYTHSQTTHFDGDYNSLTNKPTIPTVPNIATILNSVSTNNETTGAKLVYDELLKIANDTYIADANNPTSILCKANGDTLNTPYKEGLTNAAISLIISVARGADSWNGQISISMADNKIYVRNKGASGWNAWQKLLTKSDITTTINSSSTNDQIPTAKSVYDKSLPYVYPSSINEDPNTTTSPTTHYKGDNGPKSDLWFNILTFFTDQKNENMEKTQLAFTPNNGDIYTRTKGYNLTWQDWRRLCTTKVADTNGWVNVTLNEGYTGNVSYRVKNGVCIVRIKSLKIPSTAVAGDVASSKQFPPNASAIWSPIGSDNLTASVLCMVGVDGSLSHYNYSPTTNYFGEYVYFVD